MNIHSFISAQLAGWPMAAANHNAIGACLTRTVDTGSRLFTLQHNPARAISTAAATDAASIAARPCFLCACNRPPQQTGLTHGHYEILLNPYPIFPGHLTIPDSRHTPQSIHGRTAHMLDLCEQLSDYTIFYNGAACGASAPDHQHFQAAPSRHFPLWQAIDSSTPVARRGDTAVYDIMPACIVADNASAEAIDRILSLLPCGPSMPEPMVNILARRLPDGRHQAVIIPRRRHRPSNFGTAPGQRLISPASVDLAGVVIAPRESDFQAITAEELAAIINEVTYPSQTLTALI